MSFRPFTSESYAQDDRPEAWRDVLAAVGLQPATGHSFLDGHATASHRHAAGVALTRMAAGAQTIAPLSQSIEDLPIALMPVEDGMVLRSAGGHRIVPIGHLVLLPRSGDWSIVFQRDMRAIVLSVTSDALRGRLSGRPRLGEPRVVPPSGFADVFARLLDATARSLDSLSDAEWNSVAHTLVDLLLTLAHQLAASTPDAGSSATQAALLHRICQTIERRLEDPELVPARVAQAEGISERYLQKLFETVGDNFTHYVRERRLQRAWADLSNPTEAHRSISEIAYAYGFGDSAHFSRAFRHRFGLPPREFRQQEAERATVQHGVAGQRGWPQDALAQLRAHQLGAEARGDVLRADSEEPRTAERRHHHLPIEASRVHWGYFSRSLQPQLEIASGYTITIETLTQHALKLFEGFTDDKTAITDTK
ncbi:MAG: helix-turn-helix domain-containing protein, partial [Bradyrhizobium sp.]